MLWAGCKSARQNTRASPTVKVDVPIVQGGIDGCLPEDL
jgi:hypothetical protein